MSMYWLNGTSMAAGVVSGVVALMLQKQPKLTPDEVKFRLMNTARSAVTDSGALIYNVFQQGSGKIWAPDSGSQRRHARSNADSTLNLTADLNDIWQIPQKTTTMNTTDSDGDGVVNGSPGCLNKTILFISSSRPLPAQPGTGKTSAQSRLYRHCPPPMGGEYGGYPRRGLGNDFRFNLITLC